jgi:DNA-directed RNA polymerase specialized sigma24 family protein
MKESTNKLQDISNNAASLYWLALLLTGHQDVSIDIASDTAVSGDSSFFAAWMRSWQRRLVIAKAVAAVRDELADSARRTQLARLAGSAAPPRNWTLKPGTTKAELERALLAIDRFPRAALLLLVFEGIRMADAAALLDAEPALIRKGQAIGLRLLTANLSGTSSSADSGDANSELLHA